MSLPIFQTQVRELSMLQTKWAESLNPLLEFPLSSGLILSDIALVSGSNTINHKLGRKLQGWIVKRMRNGFVQLYDLQDTNQMSDLTLVLNSSGSGLIDLIVF